MALKEQQYQILQAKDTSAQGTRMLMIPELHVLVLTKRHASSGNEIEHYPVVRESPQASGGRGGVVRLLGRYTDPNVQRNIVTEGWVPGTKRPLLCLLKTNNGTVNQESIS